MRNTHSKKPRRALAVLVLAPAACDNSLQGEIDKLKGELADKAAQIEALEGEKTALEAEKAALVFCPNQFE